VTPVPIVALDVASTEAALGLVGELGDSCRFYKVGSELFTATGPSIVRELRRTGAEVFLDLKYHDIPNTVAGAVRNAAALGARLLTVHAAGGGAMVRAAVEAAGDSARCGVLAVTLLTSLDAEQAATLWGRSPKDYRVADEVLRLSELAASAGALGVVCGGGEAKAVKARFDRSLVVLIPGVRLPNSARQDQARVSTPRETASAGADYVVVGRAVTAAPDRRRAMAEVISQLKGVPAERGSLA